MIQSVKTFLGKDGIAFFRECKENHGTVSPVLERSQVLIDGEYFEAPHSVHFREGMQVRNHLRSSNLCKDWDSIDLDDNWSHIVEEAIK